MNTGYAFDFNGWWPWIPGCLASLGPRNDEVARGSAIGSSGQIGRRTLVKSSRV
jgi:hypothetical protein